MLTKSKIYSIFITLYFCVFGMYSQTNEERREIIKHYDLEKLNELSKIYSKEYSRNKTKAYKYARDKNLKTRLYYDDKSYAELQGITADSTLIYYRTNNVDAAVSTRTNYLNTDGGLGFNLDGQNMTAYVWDGGHALTTHLEYDGPGGNDRVSLSDVLSEGGVDFSNHATHVIGTICATGLLAGGDTKGMAPHAKVNSYKWNNDISEAILAASNGMLLSNHSYGLNPVSLPDYFFGAYTQGARSWDEVLYNAPFYLMVVSAGNAGNANINETPLDPNFPQFDKLTSQKVSKNNLVVANAQDASIDVNGNLVSVNINIGSSQGPTDDLRIKPDITGNGTGLLSSIASSDNSLGTYTGTSMSSPNLTGSLLLLQQHYNNLYNTFMRASTLKGLALHTADDAGINGPDANFGWGLLNAKKAAETISNKNTSSIIEEILLNNGETYSLTVESDGINDLLASISWTDPAGNSTTNLNDSTPVLVNDLDITITQNTNTFYPWRLTGVNSNADDTDNNKDNFERVDIQNPSGNYTITISHKGNLTNNQQYFSLIVTGITNPPLFCSSPQSLQVESSTSTTAEISWNASPSVPTNGYDYVLITNTSIPDENTTPTGNVNATNTSVQLAGLLPNTYYDFYVRANCGLSNFSDWSRVLNFITPCTTTNIPYLEDFEGGSIQSSCLVFTEEDQVQISSNCLSNVSQFLKIFGGVHSVETRAVDLNAESLVEVSYDINIGCVNSSQEGEVLKIEYWDGSIWQLLETIDPVDLPSTWINKFYYIDSGLTSSFKLKFSRQGGTELSDDISIDNLRIDEAGSCSRPIDLNISNITENTAFLSWNFSFTNPSNGYDYYITSSLAQPDISTIPTGSVTAGITNVGLTGLTASTQYFAFVRLDCGTIEGNSEWSSPFSFYTVPLNDKACNAIPLIIDQSSLGNQFLLTNASAEPFEPTANLQNGIDGSVWFKFIAPTSGDVRITTDILGGTADDSEIAVYSVEICSNFSSYVQVGFDQDDGKNVGEGWMSVLDLFDLNAGETYFIQVDRWENSRAGSFGIEVLNLTYTYSTVNGYLPSSPDGKELTGYGGDLIGGSLEIIDGTATLSNPTALNQVIVNTDGILDLDANISADLFFKSNSFGNGQLDDATGITITGEVNVEHFIPVYTNNTRGFRFLTSTVNTSGSIYDNWQEGGASPAGYGTHITGSVTGANGFDATSTGNPSMFTFSNTSTNQSLAWLPIPNTNLRQLSAGEPYLLTIRGDRNYNLSSNPADSPNSDVTLRATGMLHTGDMDFDLNQLKDYYSFIANPYQAMVDMSQVVLNSNNINPNFFWYWDPNLGSNGAYTTISIATGLATGSTTVNQYLMPGQSLFVQTIADGPANITFTESSKSVNASQTSVFSNSTITSLDLLLYTSQDYNTGNNETDAIKIMFSEDYDNLINTFDAMKFYNPNENLSRLNNGVNLSVESRALPVDNEVLTLSTSGYSEENYTFVINSNQLPEDIIAYFNDIYTGVSTPLNDGVNLIDFTIDASIPESMSLNRFSIGFDNSTLSIDKIEINNGFSLYPNPTNRGYFKIKTYGLTVENVELKIYNLLGQQVIKKTYSDIQNSSFEVDASALSSGVYMVKLQQDNRTYTQKLIVE